jgi:hypothetical protein
MFDGTAVMGQTGREQDEAAQVLRSIWGSTGQTSAEACKNMQHVSFDGMAEPGTNLAEAWRDRLRREGKLSSTGGTVRDLVLGTGEPR